MAASCWYGCGRNLADRRRTHHSVERQRGLRALLEPALADVTLRRLCRGEYGGQSNAHLCAGIAGQATVSGTGVITPNCGCYMDWNTWWVGSRTQWNVTKDFYMGVDVMYSKLEGGSLAERLYAEPDCSVRPATASAIHQQIRTTGRSASASIATSIPDRVIMDL